MNHVVDSNVGRPLAFWVGTDLGFNLGSLCDQPCLSILLLPYWTLDLFFEDLFLVRVALITTFLFLDVDYRLPPFRPSPLFFALLFTAYLAITTRYRFG